MWISKNALLCRVFANRVTYMVKATGLQLKELKSGPNILPTKPSHYIAIQHMYFAPLSGLYCSLLAQMRVKTQQIMSSYKLKSGHRLLGKYNKETS